LTAPDDGRPSSEPVVLCQLALRAAPATRQSKDKKKQQQRDSSPADDCAGTEETTAMQARRASSRGTWRHTGAFHLVVAVEPTGAERLLVGRWRHLRGGVLAEGLVVGDHLSAAEVARVSSSAQGRRSAIRRPATAEMASLAIYNTQDFAEGPLYRRGIRRRTFTYKTGPRKGHEDLARGANLVAYDAAFVLSRFSRHVGVARDGVYRGGLSIALAGEMKETPLGRRFVDEPGYPRLLARQLHPDVTLVQWAADRLMADDGVMPGWILDLAQLGGALAGISGPSLGELCRLYGVNDPGPQPSGVTAELFDWLDRRLATEIALYDAIAVEVDAWRAGGASKVRPPWLYSSGGLASQVLDSAGYVPPAKSARLAAEVAGAFAASFYGGRTEASLLRSRTPMVVYDFSSNYVSVAALLGIGDLFAAERIVAEDVTDELATFLAELEASPDPVAALLDPSVWRRFGCTVAMTMPDGEWLVHRALIGPGKVSVGFGPLRSPTSLPYCWADLAAAVLRGGRAPRITRAWRLVTEGSRELTEVRLPGTRVVIGGETDVFVALLRARSALKATHANPRHDRVRRRREAAIKRLGNAAAFGNLSRFDRERARESADPTDFVDPWGAMFEVSGRWSEERGPWTFLPAAASVTAAARLVVALGERVVHDAGGTVAAIHTDSLMIPASPDGGLFAVAGGPLVTARGEEAIALLSWHCLDELFAAFDVLRLDGGRAWKPEHGTRDRLCHVTVYGANRYIVSDAATGEVLHGAESHLGGTLCDPSGKGDELLFDGRRAWVAAIHQAILDDEALPDYTARPAVSSWRATTCEQLDWLRYELAGAQPFTRFLLAHRSPGARIARAPRSTALSERAADDPAFGSPIAPFDPDPDHFEHLSWRRRDGTPVTFVMADETRHGYALGSDAFEAARVADTVARWQTGHDAGTVPISRRARSRGDERTFAGRYRRLPVEATESPVLIGREGDMLVEAERGVLSEPDERITVFSGRGSFVGDVAAECVRSLTRELRGDLADAKIAPSTLRAFRAGRDLQAGTAARLLAVLDPLVLDLLLARGVSGEIVAESPRGVRYEMARRLLDATAVVSRSGAVETRCGLPGCTAPRRTSYPYCSREHEKEAAGYAAARCGYPGCELPPARPRARYCSESHRGAMADRRRRARIAAARAGAIEGGTIEEDAS